MKYEYINKLEELLNRYDLDQNEKEDIIADYQEMYDSWLEKGMSEEEVEEKLGNVKDVVKELTEGVSKKSNDTHKKSNHKLTALMPFISLVIFFTLGFAYDLWYISWTAFLLIPITALVTELASKKDKNILIGISPFVSLILFFILGFYYDMWHPGWMVFLLIPILGIVIGADLKGKLLLTALSPFLVLIGFFFIGEMGYYHPGWLIFILIPLIGSFNEKNLIKRVYLIISFLIAIIGYLYLYYIHDYGTYMSFLSFTPIGLYVLYQGVKELSDMTWGYRITIVLSVIAYVLLGYYFNLWGYAWLVFFSIPSYAIITEVEKDDQLISLSPFIAVIIFFTLGWFFHLWIISWLAFLIIPVIAIIKES